MRDADLVRMANQIACYFAAYPEEEAVAGIADHLKKFWEPHMRASLQAYIAKGGADLNPLVLKADKMLTKDGNAATG